MAETLAQWGQIAAGLWEYRELLLAAIVAGWVLVLLWAAGLVQAGGRDDA
jgi:hypothetical protein